MLKYNLKIISILSISLIILQCQKDKKDLKRIRIGYQPLLDHIALIFAIENNWLKEALNKYGIKEIETKEFPTGPPEIHSMLAGELDIAYVGIGPPIAGMYEGLDAKIVAGVNSQGSAIIIQKTLSKTYNGAHSFKGKKIGTYPPGSIHHTILTKWLKENGINPETEVDIKVMGPDEAVLAFKKNIVDAVFLPSPYPAILIDSGDGEVVEWSHSLWKGHICCVIVSSGRIIRQYPEILKEVLKVHIMATEYVNNHLNEIPELFKKWTGIEKNITELSLKISDNQWIHNPEGITIYVNEYARVIYEINKQRFSAKGITQLTLNSMLDLSFYKSLSDGK